VLIMSDNTTAVACLLHQGTLRSDSLMCLSQSILEYCLLHSITPVPKHLCGALNVVADQGSRRGVISTEWSLDVRTFQWISSLAGPFQVDLFATRYNTHLPSFVSPFPDPLALDFNALSLQWDVWDSLYLFPPVPLLHQIVPRLCRFKGRGVLIAPYYAQSAWFTPLLLRSPNPVPLPDFHLLSQVTNHGQVFHSNPAVFSLHVWRLWRSLLGSCFSDQTISILCLAHKPSTTSQYQSVWSLFLNFLADRGLTSLDMTEVSCVGIVCDFLAYHSSLGKQYRTIASYRSALRHPILFTCGVDIRSEASDLFMRGLFNFHPPVRSRPMPLWSLASLLDFLCGPPFEPLESASFRALVRKTLCLLLLATGRRIGEIAHLSRLYKPSASSISLHLVPGFTPKHHTQTFQSSKPSIAYLDSDKSLSHLLCPVRAYFIYQRKSSLWANSLAPALRHHFLWSSPNSPLPVSKGSLTSHFIALVHDCR
ncbi:unnamed protein product, partial [Meganyctiphanes norvegica]